MLQLCGCQSLGPLLLFTILLFGMSCVRCHCGRESIGEVVYLEYRYLGVEVYTLPEWFLDAATTYMAF